MSKKVWQFAVSFLSVLAFVACVQAGWFDDYKTLQQYNLKLDEFLTSYPALTSPITLGTSVQGRPIRGIRITGNGPSSVAKKTVVLDGLMHAREWIAGMVPMYVADQLLTGYGNHTRVTNILDNVEFLIAPVVNPDGYEYTWTNQRLWRKNRRNNGGGSFGVDLNRNFGVGWGLNSGSSGNPNSDVYRGPAPFSEPEAQAIRDTFLANQDIVSYINFHSYSQLILSPWGYTTATTPDADLFLQLGAQLSSTIQSVHGTLYEHGPASTELYLASGTAVDWAYGNQGVYSYVIELRPGADSPFGFELPPSQIIPTSEEMWPAMLDLAEFTMALAGGDFNYDQIFNCTDVDKLVAAIVNGSNRAELDLTGDGLINSADLANWLVRGGAANLPSGGAYLPGDANLDGVVDGGDFNIWNSNKFTANPSWCRGDFNADGFVDGSDFNAWNSNKFSSSDTAMVPEPTSITFLLLIGLGIHARSFLRA